MKKLLIFARKILLFYCKYAAYNCVVYNSLMYFHMPSIPYSEKISFK